MKKSNPYLATLEQAHPLRYYEHRHGKLTSDPDR